MKFLLNLMEFEKLLYIFATHLPLSLEEKATEQCVPTQTKTVPLLKSHFTEGLYLSWNLIQLVAINFVYVLSTCALFCLRTFCVYNKVLFIKSISIYRIYFSIQVYVVMFITSSSPIKITYNFYVIVNFKCNSMLL